MSQSPSDRISVPSGASDGAVGHIRGASEQAPAGGTRRARSLGVALSGLALSMLLASLGTSIANVALPTLTKSFGASFQSAQWVVVAYLLAVAASIIPLGRLSDVVGRRRLLRGGLLLFAVAALVCGLAPNLSILIAARAMQGLAAAVLMTLTMAFVSELVPREKAGSAMGWLGTMSAVGTAIGPSLGGLLIHALGWRSIFLFQVPLGLLAALFVHHHLPADPTRDPARGLHINLAGTLLLTSTLVTYALAMMNARATFARESVGLFAIASIGLVSFVVMERQSRSPLFRQRMFEHPALRAGLASSLLVSTVLMATLVVGPFYLTLALGLDARAVGLILSTGPVVAATTGVPAGRLVDRFGAHRMMLVGLTATAVGCFGLAITPGRLGILGYITPIVMLTAGYALFQAGNNTSVMQASGASERGVVSGTLNLSRTLGLITGASLMGGIFALGAGSRELSSSAPAEIASGTRLTFVIATALVLIAIAIVVRVRVDADPETARPR